MSSIETIINRQFRIWESQIAERAAEEKQAALPPPIVTVSREKGSRGTYFAGRLAASLGYQCLHRDVIDAISASTGYRRQIIEWLDEHYRTRLELTARALVERQAVDHTDYVRNLSQMILSMARLGGVVLVGRGGNFILGSHLGFHIRFVCSRDQRVENLAKFEQLNASDAARAIDRSDADRREWIRKVFGAEIDNPRNYDLTINTALLDAEEIVPIIVSAIRAKTDKLAHGRWP